MKGRLMAKEKNEKALALEETIKTIEKTYGKGAIMRLGERPNSNVDTISSGSIALDIALGVGGYPKGRVIEIFGPESSGKTTLALHAIAEAQARGGRAAFVDAEHAIDPVYAKKLGVNIDELILSQPDSGEQALEIVEMLAHSNAIDIIIVDSVAALVPQ
jgi:recombination protein RecA